MPDEKKVPRFGKRQIRRIAIPLLIVAIGCVWSLSAADDGAAQIERMTATAGGTVVDMETHTHKDRDTHREETTYRPVVEFEDSDHESHRAKSLYARKGSAGHAIGSSVGVRYDPRDADNRCIIVGEEELAKEQVGERGPLGIIIAIVVAAIAFILL